jgi:hypothetical protein
MHAKQHRIAVAIGPCCEDFQTIAGRFPFRPQPLPGTAVERNEARQQSRLQSFAVHEAQHEQLGGVRILNDGGHQPLHFVEVDLHRNLLFPHHLDQTCNRNKNPAAARFASAGLDFGLVLSFLSAVLRRHARRMVMVAVMAERTHNEPMVVRRLLFVNRVSHRVAARPAGTNLLQAQFHLALFAKTDVQHLFFSAHKLTRHRIGLSVLGCAWSHLHPEKMFSG